MESRNKTTKSHYQVGAGCSAAEEQGEGEGDVEEEAASPISNLADESTLGDHAPPTTATASTTCNDGERGKMDGGGVKIPPAGGGSDYYDGDEEGKRRRWKQENADVDADGDEKRNGRSPYRLILTTNGGGAQPLPPHRHGRCFYQPASAQPSPAHYTHYCP